MTWPRWSEPPEKDQIAVAVGELTDAVKRELVTHANVAFFVDRVPVYGAHELKHDKDGQKLNGVLSVGHSLDKDYPVWSPLSHEVYAKVKTNKANKAEIDLLTDQIVDMLYTVRNNLFHGGKRADDAHDTEVLEKAISLLEILVRYFFCKQP